MMVFQAITSFEDDVKNSGIRDRMYFRPRFQRGRGVGGIFRTLMKGIVPVVNYVGKFLKSPTGKAIKSSVKRAAVESGGQFISDVVAGKNMKESLKENSSAARDRIANRIKQLSTPSATKPRQKRQGKRKKKQPVKLTKTRPRKRRRLFSSEEEDEFTESED